MATYRKVKNYRLLDNEDGLPKTATGKRMLEKHPKLAKEIRQVEVEAQVRVYRRADSREVIEA